jgi:RnfABCDGE-type electron transport complex C subunit
MSNDIINKVRDAGVVGAGGAGFPTHVKLNAKVKRVLVNGASCEPLLSSDPWLMKENPELLMRGLNLVMKCTQAERGTICIKNKHHEVIKTLKKTAKKSEFKKIDVFELEDFYPAGDEHVLVYEVTGNVVPEGGIPLEVGVVVSNVESLINIVRAVEEGHPVIERYLTVTGEVKNHLIVKVPIGTAIGEIIDMAGGVTIDNYKIVIGGPMMGTVTDDLSTPVTKTTSGIIVLPANHNVVAGKITDPDRILRLTQVACCQCMRCTDTCPRNLLGHVLEPHMIMRNLRLGVTHKLMEDALICSECGICEKYACPMLVSPREVNRQIKSALMKKGHRRERKKDEFKPSFFMKMRKIPSKRLVQKLQLGVYDTHPDFFAQKSVVKEVDIPLQQHIGALAIPLVKSGDRVNKGDLIAQIPEKKLGATVHASIGGIVSSVGETITIKQATAIKQEG